MDVDFQERDEDGFPIIKYVTTRMYKKGYEACEGNLNYLSKNDPLMEYAERLKSVTTYAGQWHLREDAAVESPCLVSTLSVISGHHSSREEDQLFALYLLLKSLDNVDGSESMKKYLSGPVITKAWEEWLDCREQRDLKKPEIKPQVQPFYTTGVLVPAYRASVALSMTGGARTIGTTKNTLVICRDATQASDILEIPGSRVDSQTAMKSHPGMIVGGTGHKTCLKSFLDTDISKRRWCPCLTSHRLVPIAGYSSGVLQKFSTLSPLQRKSVLRTIDKDLTKQIYFASLNAYPLEPIKTIEEFYTCISTLLQDRGKNIAQIFPSSFDLVAWTPRWIIATQGFDVCCVGLVLKRHNDPYFIFDGLTWEKIADRLDLFCHYIALESSASILEFPGYTLKYCDAQTPYKCHYRAGLKVRESIFFSMSSTPTLVTAPTFDAWVKTMGPDDPEFVSVVKANCAFAMSNTDGIFRLSCRFISSNMEIIFCGSSAEYEMMNYLCSWVYRSPINNPGYISWNTLKPQTPLTTKKPFYTPPVPRQTNIRTPEYSFRDLTLAELKQKVMDLWPRKKTLQLSFDYLFKAFSFTEMSSAACGGVLGVRVVGRGTLRNFYVGGESGYKDCFTKVYSEWSGKPFWLDGFPDD